MNDSLFDVGASAAPSPNQAADATRRLPTCWHACGHATMTVKTDPSAKAPKHTFKLCYLKRDQPRRIYATDTICDFWLERVSSPEPKPVAPGWEDY